MSFAPVLTTFWKMSMHKTAGDWISRHLLLCLFQLVSSKKCWITKLACFNIHSKVSILHFNGLLNRSSGQETICHFIQEHVVGIFELTTTLHHTRVEEWRLKRACWAFQNFSHTIGVPPHFKWLYRATCKPWYSITEHLHFKKTWHAVVLDSLQYPTFPKLHKICWKPFYDTIGDFHTLWSLTFTMNATNGTTTSFPPHVLTTFQRRKVARD